MYQTLDPKQTTELVLLRHGWFSPEYELTDRTDSYGNLTYEFLSRRTATVASATNTWIFSYKELFSRTILITGQDGAVIGETTRDWFSRRRLLTMQSGFQAEFYRRWFVPWEYIWESEGYGEIMRIKRYPLNLKDKIHINQSMAPPALIPLLIFLGAHLTILRRRRKSGY
jgi:hypothetical protein